LKAAIIEANDTLVVKDIPEPELAGDYDVKCEILYCSVCAGTDAHLIDGSLSFRGPLPTVLGHESIGRVIEVGSKVRNFEKGDLVIGVTTPPVGEYSVSWGAFAEYGITMDYEAAREGGLPEDKLAKYRREMRLPRDIDPAAATMLFTWRETLSYAKRIGVEAGKSVLVIGSGGNGLAFAAHAGKARAQIVAMLGAGYREEVARKVGVTDYIDYKSSDIKARVDRICPGGFDVILDVIGKVGVADAALRYLGVCGTIGVYGVDDYGKVTLNPLNARGTFIVYQGGYDPVEVHQEALEDFTTGRLDPSLWLDLDRIYNLDDINEAIEAVRTRKAIKTLVQIAASA
jgi:threonine dehydrogenase-like Zn-dependent dehydrogenase